MDRGVAGTDRVAVLRLSMAPGEPRREDGAPDEPRLICECCPTCGVDVPETAPVSFPLRSNREEVNVSVGFVTVRRSVLELKPSGPRGFPTNCGHSDGFSPRAAKEFRGEVCGR